MPRFALVINARTEESALRVCRMLTDSVLLSGRGDFFEAIPIPEQKEENS